MSDLCFLFCICLRRMSTNYIWLEALRNLHIEKPGNQLEVSQWKGNQKTHEIIKGKKWTMSQQRQQGFHGLILWQKEKKVVHRSELPNLWLFYVQLFLHLIIFPEIVAKKPTRKCSGIFGSLALLEREVEYRNIWKRRVVVNHLNCPLRLLEPHYISGDQLEKQPS